MISSDNIAIEAATDGACSGNPGKGGWGGLILFENGNKIEIGGVENNTTNNRMELTAAIKTIEKLKQFKLRKNFKLRTDSKYLIEGYSNWINNWKKNGWKTSAGKPVLNTDLWKKLDELRLDELSMEFVKGHSGDPFNERVDLIATNYSKGIPLKGMVSTRNSSDNHNEEIAPANIKDLFSRIEMVSAFEKKGYLLNSNELSDLLLLNNRNNLKEHKKFDWRNWSIVPIEEKYWKIIKKI